ncbi:MAG: ABC transporter permease [Chloroflexi bacterium]|nr:ABC transporter permease [Chloroflexota bacterium]
MTTARRLSAQEVVLSGLTRGQAGGVVVLHLCQRKPLGAFGAFLVLALIFSAALAPVVAPFDPLEQFSGKAFRPPGGEFLLGTDYAGRDMLSRLIWGARISLMVGIIAVTIGTGFGTLLGLVSGFWGGRFDLGVQRVIDAMQAFPGLVLNLAIVASLGKSTENVMIAVGITMIAGATRIVRSAVLSTRENQYIEAARAVGCRDSRILLWHVLPNVMAPILIIATVGLGSAILAESSLSFLGMGSQPPNPSWGLMLSGSGRANMISSPWLAIFPGLAISLTVMGFNLLGDALRDLWDPRLRGSR